MMKRTLPTLIACVALAFGVVGTASADPLREAESAYQDIDFDNTAKYAQAALEAGDNSRERMGRIYFLLGLSKAALKDHDGAREAFKRMLAVQPDIKVEKSLSPQLRGPYLEARGYWNSTTARVGVKARMVRADRKLVLTVTDPVGFVSQARVRSRISSDSDFVETAVSLDGTSAEVPVEGLNGYVEYSVALLDEHRNVLHEFGSDEDPQSLGKPPSTVTPATTTTIGTEPTSTPLDPSPRGKTQRIVGGVLMGLGAVSAGIGVPFHLQREDRATTWNGSECEQNGLGTRSDQCSDIDDERKSAQTAATVFYGVGGGLVVVGAITFLAAPRKSKERPPTTARRVWCGGGPGHIGVACAGQF